jgi:hypothetical protein
MVSSREDIVFAGFMPDVDAPDISPGDMIQKKLDKAVLPESST